MERGEENNNNRELHSDCKNSVVLNLYHNVSANPLDSIHGQSPSKY